MVHDAVGPYAEQARAKPLAFGLEVDAAVPHWVRGDPGRLRQVLGNLLSNAVKFTPRNGSVQVQVRQAGDIDGVPLLHFSVRDSGIGISQKQQATVFDAFTQADVSTSRRFGGSGLGLAICDRLARLMGGRIELQSELGQGSLFTLVLPLSDAGTDAEASDSAPVELEGLARAARRYAGRVVLLAEDNPVNELMMRQMLLKLGFTVRVARGGAQAVNVWEQGGVDLILMDVQMPGMNGLDATRNIREAETRRKLGRTPIVAVTASAMPGDRQACLKAGMDGYTAKPVSVQALMREMDRVLAGQAPGNTRVESPPEGNLQTSPDPTPVRESLTADAQPAIDLAKLRRRLDGDEDSLQELAQAMRQDLVVRLQGLQAALERRDAESAVAHAHGLKGSLGSMTAERGARLAKGLELAARTGDWGLFERALPLMRSESKAIEQALVQVAQDTEPDLFPDQPLTPGG